MYGVRALDKESFNTVERLQKCFQWQPLKVWEQQPLEKNIAIFCVLMDSYPGL